MSALATTSAPSSSSSSTSTAVAVAGAAAKDESSVLPPSYKTFEHAWRIATTEDKPILTDYWVLSFLGGVKIGVRTVPDEETGAETTERLLLKSAQEFTSTIEKIFKTEDALICVTMNSVYLVSKDTKPTRIR